MSEIESGWKGERLIGKLHCATFFAMYTVMFFAMSLIRPAKDGKIPEANANAFTWILTVMLFVVVVEVAITYSVKYNMSKKYAGRNVLKGRYELNEGQTGDYKFVIVRSFPYDSLSPKLKEQIETSEKEVEVTAVKRRAIRNKQVLELEQNKNNENESGEVTENDS